MTITEDKERLSEGKIKIKLKIKNSGQKKITLKKDMFKLSTIERIAKGTVILEEDFKSLIFKIFKDKDSIELVNGYDRSFEQILRINKKYFEKKNNKEITYFLETSYNYETEFSNNLEIDISKFKDSQKLKVLNKVGQAAPVKINKIDIKQQSEQGAYILSYYITRQDEFKTKIILDEESISLKLGKNNLSECKFLKRNKKGEYSLDDKASFTLVNDVNSVKYSCLLSKKDMDIYNSGIITTQTSGSIKYNHIVGLL